MCSGGAVRARLATIQKRPFPRKARSDPAGRDTETRYDNLRTQRNFLGRDEMKSRAPGLVDAAARVPGLRFARAGRTLRAVDADTRVTCDAVARRWNGVGSVVASFVASGWRSHDKRKRKNLVPLKRPNSLFTGKQSPECVNSRNR